MTELSPKEFAVTKVVVKADAWFDCRRAVQCAPSGEKARAAGKYEKSGDELAQAVEKLRSVISNTKVSPP